MYSLRTCAIRSARHVKLPWPTWSLRDQYSSEAVDNGPIRIQVGSSGSLTVDLFQPFSPITPSAFIFYLPRGPIPFSSPEIPAEPSDLRPLAESASAVVARINYRLSGIGRERYPLPIHDVASAWQWLFGLRMTQQPGAVPGPRHLPPIGICGEFIGGSLATMLALTECHAAPFPGVTAAYLGNPVVDWTMMHALDKDALENSKSRGGCVDLTGAASNGDGPLKSKNSSKAAASWQTFADATELSSTKLLPLRHKLFADRSYWNDKFASPLLFFRTPSEPEPDLASKEKEEFEAVMQTVTDEADAEGPADVRPTVPSSQAQKAPGFRVSHRRWPPVRSGLILPQMHLTIGTENPLLDQGVDLHKSVNRSVFMHEQEKGGELSNVYRATLEQRPGSGVWGGNELVRMGEWFKANLCYE